MTAQRDIAKASKAWPFKEAHKLYQHLGETLPKKGHVLFETGYGPSGLPHIGTFGEVARTTMVRNAFKALTGWKTRLICFSDDLDGMRKVPSNVPDGDALAEHLQKPLSKVPFGKTTFGNHNNAKLREFLDRFGFEYEFMSATNFYESGAFDKILLRALDKYDEIMEVMLASLRKERSQSYSCFLPILNGRVLYEPVTVNKDAKTISFVDEDGKDTTLPVTGGNVKLQWKPDFGARWAALGVDFEMYGKDHSTNTFIYDKICRILGGRAPAHYIYEMFLDEKGGKISKSDGNGISIDDWLKYASPESLSYFMYQKPQTAKRLHFDVIPKAMDEYASKVSEYRWDERADQEKVGDGMKNMMASPVYHIHGGKSPPPHEQGVSFAMLLNLATVGLTQNWQEIAKENDLETEKDVDKFRFLTSANNDKEIMWEFIKKYKPKATPEMFPKLDMSVGFAVRYFHDFIKPNLSYRLPNEQERGAMEELVLALRDIEKAKEIMIRKNKLKGQGDADLERWSYKESEDLQKLLFAIGTIHEFTRMQGWFQALYEVLLGASQGPRFGGFIAIYGVEQTAKLIDKALAGGLVNS